MQMTGQQYGILGHGKERTHLLICLLSNAADILRQYHEGSTLHVVNVSP